jgi:hypothetical protein
MAYLRHNETTLCTAQVSYTAAKCVEEIGTPWSKVLLERPTIATFYVTLKFSIVLTRAHHWSVFWARWIQHIPIHSISLRFILILFSHLYLGLRSSLFPSSVPIETLYAFLFAPTRATWTENRILLDLIIQIIFREEYKLWRSLLCNVLIGTFCIWYTTEK